MLGEEKPAPGAQRGQAGAGPRPARAGSPASGRRDGRTAASGPLRPPRPPVHEPTAEIEEARSEVEPGTFAETTPARSALAARAQSAALRLRCGRRRDRPGVRAGARLARRAAAGAAGSRGTGAAGGLIGRSRTRDRRRLVRGSSRARAREGGHRGGAPRQGPLEHRHPRRAREAAEDFHRDLRRRRGEAAPAGGRASRSTTCSPAASTTARKSTRSSRFRSPASSSRRATRSRVGLRFEDQQRQGDRRGPVASRSSSSRAATSRSSCCRSSSTSWASRLRAPCAVVPGREACDSRGAARLSSAQRHCPEKTLCF